MDELAYGGVNGLAGHNHALDDMFVTVSRGAPFALIALVALFWFSSLGGADRDKRQRLLLVAPISAGAALLINQLIIRLWNRPRPFIAHAATLLLPPSVDPSFPSDHATFGFAVATALAFVTPWGGGIALALAALLGFSRIYVGEHYPSDVVAGSIVGATIAFVVLRLLPLLEPVIGPALRAARRLRLA